MGEEKTSVGTIQLDVEINQNSLNVEMNKLAKTINGSFKNMFNGFIGQTSNFIRKSINGMFSGFKKMGQASADSSNKATKSISKMNAEYEKTQQKINEIRSELAKLYAEQDAIIMAYKDMPALSGMTKEETLEQLLKSNPKFNELSAQIDKLETKLGPLVEKNRQLAEEMSKVGNESKHTSSQMRNMGNSAKKATKRILGLTLFKRIFNREAKRATQTTSNFGRTLNRVSRIIVRNLIVYGLIIKGIRGIISYTWSALKANEQFSRSLNTIKTNLIVAFQPIYNFVLPAINALMKAIATITTYIASAISALFGKTYKQSFNAAKGLENAKKAMTGYGSAAKKAGKEVEGVLMSFDEINQLDLQSDADDSADSGGSGEFEMTAPDLSTIDMSGIEKFKEIMSKIFEPIKKAWKAEGQNTINAIKYALNEVKELIKAIGKSWLEVWTNGTGQQTVEHILRILQNIFNTVGNLAEAFRNAWEQNNIGTSIIQNIADIFNIILGTIRDITGATAEWAKGLDFTPLLESVNKLLEALKPFTENIGQGLAWLWENVLLPLASWTIEDVVPRFFELLANVLEILNGVIEAFKPLGTWLWDSFLLPIAQWTGGIIISVLDGINTGLQKLGDWIKEHQGAIQTIAILAGSFAAAWGLVNGAISTWNTIGKIASGVTDTFRTAVSFLKSPTTIAIAVIGGLIAVGVYLYKNWDEISVGLKKIWEGIKNTAETIWNGIANFFKNIWEGIKGIFKKNQDDIKEHDEKTWNEIKTKTSEIWNSLKEFFSNIWNSIKSIAETTWNGIKKVILDPINQAWTSLKEIWDNIKTYILNKWDEIRQGISNMKNNLVNAIKSPFNIAKDWINGIIRDAKNWGKNLVQNIIDGINAVKDRLKRTVSNVASIIKDFLGFSSPTKEGPGKDADKWMPNMIDMFVEGIKSNIAKVSEALTLTAGTIQQGVQPSTDDIASAVGSAVLQSMQMVENNQGQEGRDIILQIDGITVGRILGPIMDREKERIGEPVIKPI